jgi:F-box-like
VCTLLRSAQYWSDAVQTRIALVDDVVRQVPPSFLSDAAAFNLVDGEMAAIRRALRAIGTRRNALTPTCRIPTEILGEIFLLYQQASSASYVPEGGNDSRARLTLRNTPLRWVPGVAHVCRHWRAVALDYPRLWSNVTLQLGREWAMRMLTLSKSSPITIALTDPDQCEASMSLDTWTLPLPPAARRRPQLDPVDVLAQHLFHIQDLDLGACSCNILPWARLLETAAPLLEVFWVRVDPHRPGTRHDVAVPLPHNFLSTHPRLRRVFVEGAFLSSWAAGPLTTLTALSISAPDPRKTIDRTELILPTHDVFLDCLMQMPALETLLFAHCLPPLATGFTTRTVRLARLRTLNIHDRVDRCRQVLDALDIPPTTTIKVSCWSVFPPSEHDCLRVLPSLSAHLCRGNNNSNDNKKTRNANTNGSSSGGPHALSLSSSSVDGRTEFALSAWRCFEPPTVAEDREQYFGPKCFADVRLECEWDASDDPEMERRALRRACAGVPLDELRALSVRTEAAIWGPQDWYDTFVDSIEITHVAALETPGESVLDALKLSTTSTTTNTTSTTGGSDHDTNEGGEASLPPPPPPPLPPPPPPPPPQPLFPELVSLTLAGVNFVRAGESAWSTLSSAMAQRQASPACVTILDRIELRGCTVSEWMVDGLNEFTAVVVWDSVTDPDNWMHVPREVEGEDEDEDDAE